MMNKRKKVGKIEIGVSGTREEEGWVSFSVGLQGGANMPG